MHLEPYQASVMAFLFERLPIGEDIDSLEFALSGEFSGRYLVAHSVIESEGQAAHLVFTVPSYSQSVFLALTRTRLRETARILANLEDYERESSCQLSLGEVVITPGQMKDSADSPHAVLLLRTATSLDCAKVPDSLLIDGKKTLFFLVVPLTKDEWDLRSRSGHDALMDQFQMEGKELFF